MCTVVRICVCLCVQRTNWRFQSSKTLAQRFPYAVSSGETVTWTVTTASGAQHVVTGTWRYSNNAQITASYFSSSGTRFAYDDGCWGAGSNSDGNTWGTKAGVTWGHCNLNSGDYTCQYLKMNGAQSTRSGLKTFIYAGGFPSSSPLG